MLITTASLNTEESSSRPKSHLWSFSSPTQTPLGNEPPKLHVAGLMGKGLGAARMESCSQGLCPSHPLQYLYRYLYSSSKCLHSEATLLGTLSQVLGASAKTTWPGQGPMRWSEGGSGLKILFSTLTQNSVVPFSISPPLVTGSHKCWETFLCHSAGKIKQWGSQSPFLFRLLLILWQYGLLL